MATLHLLSDPGAVESCLAAIAADDALLLLGDGVFALTGLRESPAAVGALRDDAASRGVTVPEHIRSLSQTDFVGWVVAFDTSVTWR